MTRYTFGHEARAYYQHDREQGYEVVEFDPADTGIVVEEREMTDAEMRLFERGEHGFRS